MVTLTLHQIQQEWKILVGMQGGIFDDQFGAMWYEGNYTEEDLNEYNLSRYEDIKRAIKNLRVLRESIVKDYAYDKDLSSSWE